jgi:hypothetical protein
MAYSRAKSAVPGRHSRPPGAEEVRRACLAVLTMLVAQYALGIFLNLYVTVPASDQHASMLKEIMSGPFALTVHALLGLSLLGVAIMLLTRAVRLEEPALIALATTGLGAIGGAFAAGEIFVKDGGQSSASFTMALLAGVAMLCYVITLALIGSPRRHRGRAVAEQRASHARTAPGLLAGEDDQDWSDQDWTEPAWTEPVWTEPGWSEPPRTEPAWSDQPPPLPVRRRPTNEERTAVGVTWEAPWSRGPAQWP